MLQKVNLKSAVDAVQNLVVTNLTKFLMIELEGTLNKENSGGLFEE